MEKKIEAALLAIWRGALAVEVAVGRWWIDLGLSKKTEAVLQIIGILVGTVALVLVGRWLGLGVGYKPRIPTFRGFDLLAELILLMIMFMLYRSIKQSK